MKTLQKRITSLLQRHPDYFIGLISSSYPLSEEQVARFAHKLQWKPTDEGFYYGGLSGNMHLPWSRKFINTYIEIWDWYFISACVFGDKVWDENLIDDYAGWVSWAGISNNWYMPWTDKLIEEYKDKLDWFDFSWNEAIIWTSARIEKFKDYINFERLSNNTNTPWSIPGKMRYRFIIDNPISGMEALKLVEKYEEKIDWTSFQFEWDRGLTRKEADEVIESILS